MGEENMSIVNLNYTRLMIARCFLDHEWYYAQLMAEPPYLVRSLT